MNAVHEPNLELDHDGQASGGAVLGSSYDVRGIKIASAGVVRTRGTKRGNRSNNLYYT